MAFHNNDSMELFIPEGTSLQKVIEDDTKELQLIGGSFEEVAERMDYIIRLANNERDSYLDKMRVEVFRKHGYNTTELLDVPGSTSDPESEAGKVNADLHKLYSETPWLLPGEDHVGIVGVMRTRGMQWCPFDECSASDAGSNAEYRIINVETGRRLTINEITYHLARVHHLLEKGNQYGTSAWDFYEHFMPKDKKPFPQRVEIKEGDIPVFDLEGHLKKIKKSSKKKR